MLDEGKPAADDVWMVVYFGEEPGTTVHRVCMDSVPDVDDGMELTVDDALPDAHGFLLETAVCSYPGPECPDEVQR